MTTLFQKYVRQLDLVENRNKTQIVDKNKEERAQELFKKYRDGNTSVDNELISLLNMDNFNAPKYSTNIERDVGEGIVSKVPRNILNDVNRHKALFKNIDGFVVADDGGGYAIVNTKILLGISQILSRMNTK